MGTETCGYRVRAAGTAVIRREVLMEEQSFEHRLMALYRASSAGDREVLEAMVEAWLATARLGDDESNDTEGFTMHRGAPAGRGAEALGDMGSLQSLRNQVYMDSRSKMISALSNMLKKMGDTEASIIQNLK
ncbi:MAG: hypothetical protein HYX32_09920 [Actinobacteria bacterium]|nr:hypothetical protein [Actinomycetota bacterium]